MSKFSKKEELQRAIQRDDQGRVKGIIAVAPGDRVVLLRPETVTVTYDSKSGEDSFEGLKDGWRLGDESDLKRKQDEEAARNAAPAPELDAAPAPELETQPGE